MSKEYKTCRKCSKSMDKCVCGRKSGKEKNEYDNLLDDDWLPSSEWDDDYDDGGVLESED